jgi:hypothetical protein
MRALASGRVLARIRFRPPMRLPWHAATAFHNWANNGCARRAPAAQPDDRALRPHHQRQHVRFVVGDVHQARGRQAWHQFRRLS